MGRITWLFMNMTDEGPFKFQLDSYPTYSSYNYL